MTCQTYQQRLVTYLHGRLEADQRGELETHLKDCAMCAQELEEFKQLEGALRDFANMAPPDPEKTLAAVNAKIDAWEAQQQRLVAWRPDRLVRYGGIAAAAVASLVLVVRPLYVKLAARSQPTPAFTDRLTSPAPRGHETLEDARQGQRMPWSTATPTALRLEWTIRNPIEATIALRQWLTQVPEATWLSRGHEDEQQWRPYLSRDHTVSETSTSADTEQIVMQLPGSWYPALLAELAKHGRVSSPRPAPEALSTDQALTVELSLITEGGNP